MDLKVVCEMRSGSVRTSYFGKRAVKEISATFTAQTQMMSHVDYFSPVVKIANNLW